MQLSQDYEGFLLLIFDLCQATLVEHLSSSETGAASKVRMTFRGDRGGRARLLKGPFKGTLFYLVRSIYQRIPSPRRRFHSGLESPLKVQGSEGECRNFRTTKKTGIGACLLQTQSRQPVLQSDPFTL